MKYAVHSLWHNPHEPRYAALAPIACRLWRAAGWQPLVLLFDDGARWSGPLCERVEAELAAVEALIFREPLFAVPAWSHNPHFHCVTASRRPFCARWPEGSDTLLLSDTDMLVFRAGTIALPAASRLLLHGADLFAGCGGPVRYPTCYQAATAATWAEIIALPPCGDLAEATALHMESTRAATIGRWRNWDCEPGFQACLEAWGGYPGDCQLVNRLANPRRLAYREADPAEPLDCHCREEWQIAGFWRRIARELAAALGEAEAAEVERYRAEVLAIVQKGGAA